MGGRGEGLGVDIEGGGQVGFSWFRGNCFDPSAVPLGGCTQLVPGL